MEESVFPAPAVARVLEQGFVEARLHADGRKNIDRILELQEQLTATVAIPHYVIIDPETGEKLRALGRVALADEFLEFLNGA
jgi:hypothetical protein